MPRPRTPPPPSAPRARQVLRRVDPPERAALGAGRRRPRLRPRRGRVRVDRPHFGQPPVQDRGRLVLHLRAVPERRLPGRQRGVRRARGHLRCSCSSASAGPAGASTSRTRCEGLPLAPAAALRRARLPGPARPGARRRGLLPRLRARARQGVGRVHRARRPARAGAHAARGGHRRAAQHHLRRRGLAHPGPPPLPGRLAARRARRHPPRHLPRRHRPGADPRLRPHRAGSATGWPPAASR